MCVLRSLLVTSSNRSFLNTRVLAPLVPIPRAPKNYFEPPKTTVTSEMDKDEIEIVDESPKLPTQCELRHAIGVFNIVSIFSGGCAPQ